MIQVWPVVSKPDNAEKKSAYICATYICSSTNISCTGYMLEKMGVHDHNGIPSEVLHGPVQFVAYLRAVVNQYLTDKPHTSSYAHSPSVASASNTHVDNPEKKLKQNIKTINRQTTTTVENMQETKRSHPTMDRLRFRAYEIYAQHSYYYCFHRSTSPLPSIARILSKVYIAHSTTRGLCLDRLLSLMIYQVYFLSFENVYNKLNSRKG